MSGHFAPEDEWHYELQGVLKLHGTERAITLTGSVQIPGSNLAASAHFALPYTEWGVKNPSTFILRVSDKVQIDIMAAGHLTFPPAARD
jgi:hypothetical protein